MLENYDILAIPGGFSYGDDTGSGNAMAWKIRLNLFDDLKKFIADGKLVIGICNGFQILANLGLFHNERKVALCHNDSAVYECRWVYIKPEGNSVWTKGLDVISMPVAHGEGRFTTKDKTLVKKLIKNKQIIFRFCDKKGNITDKFPINPNGAMYNIAAISNKQGNIMAIMPHPERSSWQWQMPNMGKENKKYLGIKVFESMKRYIEDKIK